MLVFCLIARAFAVDVDGTLTDRNLLLDLEAVAALRQLEARKVKVIITTGRNFSVTRALVSYLGTCGLLVAENGGIIGVYPKTRIILGDPARSREGLQVLRRALGDEMISELDVPFRLVDVVLEPRFDLRTGNAILARNGVKAHLVHSGVAYHVLDSDVDKGVGLSRICEANGIDMSSVVAVGDSYNDCEMLDAAGYGIAVANAPEELKNHADFVSSQDSGKGFVEAVDHIISEFGTT